MSERNSMRGRGAGFNTPNKFERHTFEALPIDVVYEEDAPPVPTTFLRDTSRSILSRNDSPDVPFTFSVNPYRGCEHGCIYCYARPSHEYLGFSAGLDFETKIMVKLDAPELLEEELSARSWEPQVVAFSGNTDPYQPAERTLRLTRRCLAVFLDHRNPAGMITKNSLILRDLDILQEMARRDLVHVTLSITTLDPALARVMEPRTAAPRKRLEAIRALSEAGVPVGVNVSPVIPGLTDEEIPAVLEEAAAHGATAAGCTLVRLPGQVEPLFIEWLRRELPERASRIINRIRETRGGKLSDARFGSRMMGEGEMASVIHRLFSVNAEKLHLSGRWRPLAVQHFVRDARGQLGLFESSGG